MKIRKPALWLLLAMTVCGGGLAAGEADTLGERIAALLKTEYPAGQPGAAVMVSRNGKTIFRGAFGMADLELGVPLQADMVFRLGSITKQFTAVAILILEEEGKLKLSDDIRRFLPDFPQKSKPIRIEHLLTHSSGVRSYTDLPEWLNLWRKDMKLDELIALFKDLPLEFEPGSNWKYSNSGYILLGAVIEKASGMSYKDFVEQRIFQVLGMKHSGYDLTEKVIPRRVGGYQAGPDGLIHAPYLSMTQPYAAGALLSCVDDLTIWHQALLAGKLIRPDSLQKAHSAFVLDDGRSTGYGYGWTVSEYAGHPTIEHGGGINGFLSYAISLPADGVYVALLQNFIGKDPETLAFKLAAMTAGIPLQPGQPVNLPEELLRGYCGVYEHGKDDLRAISLRDGRLESRRNRAKVLKLTAVKSDEFRFEDSFNRLRFGQDEKGSWVMVVPRTGMTDKAYRTDKTLPPDRVEIALDVKILQRYVGVYELQPGFDLSVTLQGGQLMAQATGQAMLPLFAESEFRFFLKAVDAQLEFAMGTDNRAVSLTLYQNGQIMPARRRD